MKTLKVDKAKMIYGSHFFTFVTGGLLAAITCFYHMGKTTTESVKHFPSRDGIPSVVKLINTGIDNYMVESPNEPDLHVPFDPEMHCPDKNTYQRRIFRANIEERIDWDN